jgi:hypothetical protein
MKGQILRLVGMLIEIPCVLALFYYKQGRLGDWSDKPVDLGTILSVGIGIGFVLWLSGTILTRWPIPKQRAG